MTAKQVRHVRIKQAQNGQHYYAVIAGNNEILYTSETYSRHADAIEAAVREHQGRDTGYLYILEYIGNGEPVAVVLNLPDAAPAQAVKPRRRCWFRRRRG